MSRPADNPDHPLAEVLDERRRYSITEICECSGVAVEELVAIVHEGIVNPPGTAPEEWQFSGHNLVRVRQVVRLRRDLGVNLAGAALALDLMEELQQLRRRTGYYLL